LIRLSEVELNAIALVSAMLLVSAITIAPTVTRVWGFGMMDENETAASQDNSQAAIFTQNQLNCLKVDDGWWSPIAGPIVVNACGPPATPISSPGSNLQPPVTQTETSTPSQPITEPKVETQPNKESLTTSTPQTEISSVPPDITETKNKEGDTVLSSTVQAITFTVVVPKDSSQDQKNTNMGLAEGVQKGIEQGIPLVEEQQKKDYNMGLIYGIRLAFQIGDVNALKEKPFTPEQLQRQISSHLYALFVKNNSDDFKTGLLRGLTLGSDFVDISGVSGLKHKR